MRNLAVRDPACEAAFFDLDKTIIAKSSVLAFGKPLYREGLLSKRAIVQEHLRAGRLHARRRRRGEDGEAARARCSTLTEGWNQQHVADIVRETLDEVISPIIFAEALELFDQHHAAGRRVVIVSSSPMEVVEPLGEFLGVDEVIATRAEVDGEGNYTGELAFYAYGPFKAEAMRVMAAREDIDLSASYAYSDSITDLPMLEAVGHPVAVNPDRGARPRGARERGWEVRGSSSGRCGCATGSRCRRRGRRSRSARCSLAAGAGAAALRLVAAAPARAHAGAGDGRDVCSSRTCRRRWSRWTGSPTRSTGATAAAAGEARRPHRARARRQQGAQARAPVRRGARRRAATSLVTGGGPQSNHARMTAAAANRLGLECHIALAPALAADDDRDGQPAARRPARRDAPLHRRAAATTRSRPAIEELAAELAPTGRRPFAIPVGGASVTGAAAYVHAVDELRAQLDARRASTGSFVADGSGGTHAGLLAGLGAAARRASSASTSARVPISTRPCPRLAAEAATRAGRGAPSARTVIVDHDQFGDGVRRGHATHAIEAVHLARAPRGSSSTPSTRGRRWPG